TFFRDRGLSTDTTMYVDFALETALEAIRSKGVLGAASVRRVAVVGPGLDFTDKSEGYDFYPVQTIQPFAIVDSLIRLGLSKSGEVQLSTFDLSPRINDHLDRALRRAHAGAGYTMELPLDTTRPWSPQLVAYWRRFGDRIGEVIQLAGSASGLAVRAVRVRPDIVNLIRPRDLNIVLQRIEPASTEQFDLVVATNIFVYYDVFEQSLALSNVARMI